MSNPFATEKAWETSTDVLLPIGTTLCRIVDPSMGETNNGLPRIEMRLEAVAGNAAMGHKLNYSDKSIGKVVQLFDCAGVERPQEGEFDPHTLGLTDRCVSRLNNKIVGAVVREERGRDDPTKMFRVVAGFVPRSEVDQDVPVPDVAASVGAGPVADDDIPF